MKVLLRVLGWILLIVTIGIASCQTLLKAATPESVPPGGDGIASGER